MRTDKVAETLRISTGRVRQLITSGDLKAEKGPRLWDVDPDSVASYKLRRDGPAHPDEKGSVSRPPT